MSDMIENVEAGQYWETRAGGKAFIMSVDLPAPKGCENSQYPIRGHVSHCGVWQFENWKPSGRSFKDTDNPNDLIKLWVEPREFVQYVYETQSGRFKTLDVELEGSQLTLVAVLRGKEGDGVDKETGNAVQQTD